MLTSNSSFDANGAVSVAPNAGQDGSAVTIPDAHFLFHAEFKRTGSDLTLIGEDGHRLTIADYFRHEHLPTLLTPDGAALTGDVVEALAGSRTPGQYAQAGGTTAPSDVQAIGRVAQVSGNATAVRNGVAVALNVGDAVYKNDVIQTGANSTVGVIFGDASTFNLTANARMVLNEFVYNPAPGSANSAFINLVQGSITFIAGEVAHTGDMKVGTPVATMGIRGTAVHVDINVTGNGETRMSVLMEQGNRVGSFYIYSLSGALIGEVNNANGVTIVTPIGPLQAIANELQQTPAEAAQSLVYMQQAFQNQQVGLAILAAQPIIPQAPSAPTPPGQGGQPNATGPLTQIQATDLSSIHLNINITTTSSEFKTTVTSLSSGSPFDVPFSLAQPAPFQPTLGQQTALQITGQATNPLFEANQITPGINSSLTVLTLTGDSPTFDIAALLAAGWQDIGDGNFIKTGTFGTAALSTTSGTVTYVLDNDRQVTQALRPGDIEQDSFVIPVTDSSGKSSFTVNFTVNGSNDAPIVVTTTNQPAHIQTVSQTASVVDAGVTVSDVDSPSLVGATVKITDGAQSGDTLTINGASSGSIAVSGGHTIQFSYDSNTHVLSLSGDASLADYQAVLRTVSFSNTGDNVAGSSRTIAFQVDDGSSDDNLSDIATATIVINHAPVGTADVGDVKEDASSTVVTGNVLANDVDIDSSDTHTVTAAANATDDGSTFTIVGTYGTLVINKATGAYTYTLNNGQANVQALAEGQTVTDVFTYTNTDNNGASGSATLTISIHGSNDAPTVDLTPIITEVPIPDLALHPGTDPAAQDLVGPAISQDGRWVVFFSNDGLPTGDDNSSPQGDVFLYDRLSGATLVLTDEQHIQNRPAGEHYSGFSISADGNTAVFRGSHVEQGTIGPVEINQIYVYDRSTDTTRVLTNPDNGHVYDINDESRLSASNLIVFAETDFGDFTQPPTQHLRVTDLAGHIRTDITLATVGLSDPNQSDPNHSLQFVQADISGNGRFLTFWAIENVFNPATGSNTPTGDATLYTFDRTTGQHQVIATSGASYDPWWASMSNDGRFVVFQSDSDALDTQAGGVANHTVDIFLFDRQANGGAGGIVGITDRGDFQAAYASGALGSGRASISPDGRFVIFASDATNLVAGDTNGLGDTFVYNIQAQTFSRVSVGPDGTLQGDDASIFGADISFAGFIAAFGSTAKNFVNPAETNGTSNVFVVDRSGGTAGAVIEDVTTPGTASGSAPPNTLSTHGAFRFNDVDLADVHTVSVTGVTIDASGAPGFAVPPGGFGTLTTTVIDSTNSGHGQIAWDFVVDNAAIQGLNDFQIIRQTYTLQISDGHGGTVTQTVTIRIAGENDAAVISGDTAKTVVEAGGVNNNIPNTPTATGTLTDTDVDNPANTFQAVTTARSSDHGFGTFTLTATGLWTYTLDNNNATVQALNVGDHLTDTFTVRTIDGTVQQVTITINGANDVAIVAGVNSGIVAEAGGVNDAIPNTPTAIGTLTDNDVDNPINTFQASSGTTTFGSFTMTAAGVWTYTLNNDNATVQALNVGDHQTDTFTVHTADGTARQVIITINGANDAATITGDTAGTVTEAGAPTNTAAASNAASNPDPSTAAGQLFAADVDNPANIFQALTRTSQFGTFTLTTDGHWTYTLDNNSPDVQRLNVQDHPTDSFTVQSIDGTQQVVTITINGANDAAVIGGVATGSVTEAGGVSNSTPGTPSASGTVTDTDVDNPANTFQEVVNPAASDLGYGTFTITANGLWTYTLNNDNPAVQALNVNDHPVDTFTVRSIDGTERVISVTINGVNDAAVITGIASGIVTEAGDGATSNFATTSAAGGGGGSDPSIVTGSLTAIDVDNPDGFQEVLTPVASDHYGFFTITAHGEWSYTVDNDNADVQSLGVDDQLTDTFTVRSVDGTEQRITITINGANDAPVAVSDNDFSTTENAVQQAGDLTRIAIGNMLANDSDPDNGDSLSVASVSNVSVNEHVFGFYIIEIDTETLGSGEVARYLIRTNSGDAHLAVLDDGSVQLWSESGDDPFRTLAQGQSITINFDYTVADSHGATDTASASIQVNGDNDAPTAVGNSFSTTENAVEQAGFFFRLGVGNLLGNDRDPDSGDHLSVISVGGVSVNEHVPGFFIVDIDPEFRSFGEVARYEIRTNSGDVHLAVRSDGSVQLWSDSGDDPFRTLGVGQSATINFDYTVSDGHGGTDTAHASIQVNGSNDAPVALNNSFSTTENAVQQAGLFSRLGIGNLLSNDSDPDSGDSLSVASVNHVSVNEQVLGFLVVDIDSESRGFGEVARYEIRTNSGEVHLAVRSDGSVQLWSDSGDDPFRTLGVGQSATINFDYSVSDGHGGTDTAHASIQVNGSNDAPTFNAIARQVGEDGPSLSVNLLTAANASDPDSNAVLSAINADSTIVTAGQRTLHQGANADYTISATGVFALTAHGFAQFNNLAGNEHDSFTLHYNISDGTVALANTLNVTVNGSNDGASISGSAASIVTEDGDGVSTFQTASGTLTVSDVDSGEAHFQAVAAAALIGTYGSFTFDESTGAWTYALNNAAANVQALTATSTVHDTLTVTSVDGTADQLIDVTIHGNNDAPSNTVPGAQSVAEDGTLTFRSGNASNQISVSDIDNSDLTVTVSVSHGTLTAPNPQGNLAVTGNGGGTVTLTGAFNVINSALNGLVYAPALNYNGADTLTVDSFDGTAHTISTVTINVTPVNDAPAISGTTATGAVPSSALSGTAASYLTANHDLRNGLGGSAGFGENTLARNDDSSTGAINIDGVFGATGLNFFGHTFHSLYVNNNGNITFNGPSSTFTPDVINAGANNPIIAPFWADVDTRGGTHSATSGGHSTGSNLVYYDLDTANRVMTVTWDDVDFFDSTANNHHTSLNAFQLQLVGLGNGDFDIVFRYEDINWTAGTASGGNPNGVNGTPARAGYSAADGNSTHAAELLASGKQNDMLALEGTNGNTNTPGVFVFQVQSGAVTTAPIANGTIQFSDPDAGDTHTAAAQAAGTGYLGTFSLDPVNEATGSVAWHFTLNSNDVTPFFNPSAGQARQQFYDVTVSDGHQNGTATERVGVSVATTASDTFAFSPGAGQELVFNFATSGTEDRIDLRNFTTVNANNIVLQAINSAHDTLVDLGHGDSVTVVGVDLTQQANPTHYFMLHA